VGTAGEGDSSCVTPDMTPEADFRALEMRKVLIPRDVLQLWRALAHVFARHVETLARRLTSLAIGTLASRRSTAAFPDVPSASPSAREAIKAGNDADEAGYEPGPQGAAPGSAQRDHLRKTPSMSRDRCD
jgi:hypothetical protein